MAEKKNKAENKADGKRGIRQQDAITVYNTLKGLKISKLDKTGQFTVIRATRVLKPVATAFEDFVKDARERLKPEGFDAMQEKAERFEQLTDPEKVEVNKAYKEYEDAVAECVKPELEKSVEIEQFKGFSDDVVSRLISENPELTVERTMLLMDVCGGHE